MESPKTNPHETELKIKYDPGFGIKIAKILAKSSNEPKYGVDSGFGMDIYGIFEKLNKAERIDHLTGSLTKKAFDQDLDNLFKDKNTPNKNRIRVIVYFDIDDFKAFNSLYGHDGGDNVLKELAKVITSKLRIKEGEFLYRLGGDEFGLILDTDNLPGVMNRLNSIREELSKHSFNLFGRKNKVTIDGINTSWGAKLVDFSESFNNINPGILESRKKEIENEVDSYMYIIKNIYLIKNELIEYLDNNNISDNNITIEDLLYKNALCYPVYDEYGIVKGLKIKGNDEKKFFLPKSFIIIIENKKKELEIKRKELEIKKKELGIKKKELGIKRTKSEIKRVELEIERIELEIKRKEGKI